MENYDSSIESTRERGEGRGKGFHGFTCPLLPHRRLSKNRKAPPSLSLSLSLSPSLSPPICRSDTGECVNHPLTRYHEKLSLVRGERYFRRSVYVFLREDGNARTAEDCCYRTHNGARYASQLLLTFIPVLVIIHGWNILSDSLMALMPFIFFSFLFFERTSVSNENCFNSLHQGSKDAAVARIVYLFFFLK